MRVETIRESGPDTWVVGLCGLTTERFRKVTLTSVDPPATSNSEASFHIRRRRTSPQDRNTGVPYSLGIAYEFDPYFGLSISRLAENAIRSNLLIPYPV